MSIITISQTRRLDAQQIHDPHGGQHTAPQRRRRQQRVRIGRGLRQAPPSRRFGVDTQQWRQHSPARERLRHERQPGERVQQHAHLSCADQSDGQRHDGRWRRLGRSQRRARCAVPARLEHRIEQRSVTGAGAPIGGHGGRNATARDGSRRRSESHCRWRALGEGAARQQPFDGFGAGCQ